MEQGKLVFVNDNYEKKDVKERSLVVFTGDQANVSGDRKWEFGRVLENIKAGVTQVKVKRVDMKINGEKGSTCWSWCRCDGRFGGCTAI